MICLALSLTACGGDTKEEATNEETTHESTASDESDSSLPTLEDYFNSDAMQTLVNSTKEQYAQEDINAEMYAEGDELRYEFTINTLVGLSEEERAIFSDTLKTSMDASASSFQDTATQAKKVVSNEEVMVVVTYYDGDGNVLYTQSFSSADA